MARNFSPETEERFEKAQRWLLALEDPAAGDDVRTRFEDWIAADPRNQDCYEQSLAFRTALEKLGRDDFDSNVLRPSPAERATAVGDRLRDARWLGSAQLAFGGAAALVLAAFVIAPAVIENGDLATPATSLTAEYATRTGETSTFTLADGTEVTLGAKSAISTSFSKTSRRIELTAGAAYFDVAHDPGRAFTVRADELSATALGTAFDVRRGSGVFRVAVAEGEVEVAFPVIVNGENTSIIERKKIVEGKAVAAKAGEGLELPIDVETKTIAAWREDRLVYNGSALSELLVDVNRYSSVPIVIAEGSEAIATYRVRGVFVGSDVDALLSTLTQIYPIDVERSQAGAIRLTLRAEN